MDPTTNIIVSPNFLVTKLVGTPDTSNSKDLLDSIPLCPNY